jgi:uncharacterized RDD family membrane protein YckC
VPIPGTCIDTLLLVATPEGCEIPLRLAGPLCRARAWLLDALIRFLIVSLVVQGLAFLGGLGAGLMLVSLFAVAWLYPILFEVYGGGATPGKRMSGLVVLHDDGTPVGWSASVVRNTVRFVDFLPLFYAVGFVAMLLDAGHRRLGDMAAGTVVAYIRPVRPPAAVAPVVGEAPAVSLDIAEQRAIIEYARRADRLTPERAEELALLAGPLTAGLGGTAARKRLLSYGAFLLGRE